MGKGCSGEHPAQWRQPEGIRVADRVPLRVTVAVQALAVAKASRQDVLVHETLDLRVVVPLAHVVEAVVVRGHAAATVVEELGQAVVPAQQLAVCAVGERGSDLPLGACQLHGAAQVTCHSNKPSSA